MPDFGITETGFVTKRLDQLLAELQAEMREVFGDNLNLEAESPEGQITGNIAASNADLWEIANHCYNSLNPSAATGNALSNLVLYTGITRQSATPSTVVLTVDGVDSTVIPAGSLVSTSDTNSKFTTDSDVTLTAGVDTVPATAVVTGPLSALAGTITVIDQPIVGWDSVNNVLDAALGEDIESDAQLRARREASLGINAQSVIDAIRAGLLSVDNVISVSVLENDTAATDVNGIPPHSFLSVVQGGDDTEVATSISLSKPVGIQAFGTTTVVLTDSQGVDFNISFTRPAVIDIFVIVNLTTDDEYPGDGDDVIKQNIVDYTKGLLVVNRGFFVGDDVIQSRLYTPVNKVGGHDVDSILIGTSAPPTLSDNVVINFDQISNFDISNIVVNS